MSPNPKKKLSPEAERVLRENREAIAARLKEIEEDKENPNRGPGLTKADIEAIRDGKA